MGELMTSDYACSRARELISLQLDGELSELGCTRLAAHLAGCATCEEFAHGAEATALALRASPLERPSRQILLPQRRHVTLRVVQVGAVAAVLLVATAIGTFATVGSKAPRPNLALSTTGGSEQAELVIFRNMRLQEIKPVPVGLAGGVQ
jgi:predicted anti-sigma-YlaC factor YlaD